MARGVRGGPLWAGQTTREGSPVYLQEYDPLGSPILSSIAAALPILTLLYFIALHVHRDAQGRRHLGISAPRAALYGVVAAFAIALAVMRMPVGAAVSSFMAGTLNGFIGIICPRQHRTGRLGCRPYRATGWSCGQAIWYRLTQRCSAQRVA